MIVQRASTRIEGNIVDCANGISGIGVFGSDGTVVPGNRRGDNAGDGILVGSAVPTSTTVVEGQHREPQRRRRHRRRTPRRTTITRNTANVNADLGIEAVPGVTDGGGNKANGQRQPGAVRGRQL